MRTAQETALLLALLFKRSAKSQARLSADTLRCLSMRKHIRSVFLGRLAEQLDDLGLVLMEIDEGAGFGLLATSALADAPKITAKEYLRDDLHKLAQGEISFNDIRNELGVRLTASPDDG